MPDTWHSFEEKEQTAMTPCEQIVRDDCCVLDDLPTPCCAGYCS